MLLTSTVIHLYLERDTRIQLGTSTFARSGDISRTSNIDAISITLVLRECRVLMAVRTSLCGLYFRGGRDFLVFWEALTLTNEG
ncbi:hypothetical protein D934_10250 [Xylella fastidiosa subsp. sandyi Ann-1]|uniref:Uncharacterized protein n=1 Tax=Xylella fastidiosa subsp. sandyi Ann-1 TaxID=155920 RepID=A0A060HDP3_XYLFS|nr:hypothetical protein D934_10250 [Xylella fastidiosa subsp. sandyi Ann-1]